MKDIQQNRLNDKISKHVEETGYWIIWIQAKVLEVKKCCIHEMS